MGLLDPLKSLLGSLSSLALVGSLFKPIPPLITDVQNAVNGLGILPTGLELVAPALSDPALCNVSYAVPAPVNITFETFNETVASIYRYRQQSAVNMGGWFVHEEWMTPSLFTCAAGNRTSELDLATGFGSIDSARQAMERHWDTFVDLESDFAYLSGIGINTIRLPIGYWSLGPQFVNGTAFEPVADVYNASWPRIMNVISQAEKHQLGVIVDLHGAPGSQNGLPDSGISDGVQGLFGNESNIAATQAVLAFITQQTSAINNVVGIELLNEPTNAPELADFYTETIAIMRNQTVEAANLPLYIHDAYDLDRFAQYVANRTDVVILDHHAYYVAGGYEGAVMNSTVPQANVTSRSTRRHMNASTTQPTLNGTLGDLMRAAKLTQRNIIVGEFSCTLSPSSLADQTDPLQAQATFCSSQQAAFANITSGWAFWSFATQDCTSDWCFRSAVGSALPHVFSSWLQATNETLVDFDAPAIRQKIGALVQRSNDEILDGKGQERLIAGSSINASATSTQVAMVSATVSGSASASGASSLSSSASASTSASQYPTVTSTLASASAAIKIDVSLSVWAPASAPGPSSSAVSSASASSSIADTEDGVDDDDSDSTTDFADWYSQYVATATMYSPSVVTPPPTLAFDTSTPALSDLGLLPTASPEDAPSTRERRRVRGSRYRPRIHPRDFARRTTYTPQEQAIIRAYANGFSTATTFAQKNGSRLAFVPQLIRDSAAALVKSAVISDDLQDLYATWFKEGLDDAETQIQAIYNEASTSTRRRLRFARAYGV